MVLRMKLIDLARRLGAVEVISLKEVLQQRTSQPFGYLLVLDFEATCWEDKLDKRKAFPEIIEFPCVLYSVERDSIVAVFQQYVMPWENQKLSDFCTKLTGIQQDQVDKGVPLQTCLMLFQNWLTEMKLQYHLSYDLSRASKNKCIITTWSDWDLGICLKNECLRKRIIIPDIFKAWIDARALYIKHYLRRPKGLNGALTEVGLKFEGREHCGLDDARNTAKLIGKMIDDGIMLECTTNVSNKT